MSYKEGLVHRRSEAIYSAEEFFLRKLPVKYEVLGLEYLVEIKRLLEEENNVFATPDHRSLADTASGAVITFKEKRAFGNLIHDAVFIISLKYLENKASDFFLKGINVIPMFSPTMEEDPRKKAVNWAGIRAVRDIPEGTLFIITPEAERNKTGKMQKARRESSSFWHIKKNAYIFPIAFEETEVQWPPGKKGALHYWVGGGMLHKMRVIFGKPIEVKKVDQIVNYLSQNYDGLDSKQLSVDMVMREVAILHLTQGDKKYVEGSYYEDLMRDLADKSWLFFKPEELTKSGPSQKQGVSGS